jgi:hypothetical protein
VGQLQAIAASLSYHPGSIRNVTTFDTCGIRADDASDILFAWKSDVRHSDPVREKVPLIRAFVTALIAPRGIYLLVS